MSKNKLSATEFYADTMRKHFELCILEFAQHLQGDEIKNFSDEKKYEIVISLLAKGAVVLVALGDHLWTIRPIINQEEWEEAPRFLELSGSYKEISETLKKMKENGYGKN